MNDIQFEQLLHEEESNTLDFKEEQYPFAKATDEEKSELLKDILGFANAWRRTDAFILIGVEDVRSGRGNVLGIAEQLDDHALQQFVNSKTNRPIQFHYEAFAFEGKQVGIIRIDQVKRPIYLKHDYGKLKANEVYVRHGSSTNPGLPATLDDVALMGQSAPPEQAELTVSFAAVDRDESLGTAIEVQSEYIELSGCDEIPDLRESRAEVFNASGWRVNKDFYREFLLYEIARMVYRPFRLVVENIGTVVSNGVRIEIDTPALEGIGVNVASEMPKHPRRKTSKYSASAIDLPGFVHRSAPGVISVDRNRDRILVEVEFATLQPGRKVWSDELLIASASTGTLEFNGRILASNLPQPKEFKLSAAFDVTHLPMSVNEIVEMARRSRED